MSTLLSLYLPTFLTFVLILTRVSGLFLAAPLFSSGILPMRIRALLAAGMALLLTPLYAGVEFPAPRNLLQLMALMGQEALLGLALAVALMILFAGIQLSGQVISQLGGLAIGDVFDPGSQASMPVVSQLLHLLATAVFLLIGGHRMLVQALLDMFQVQPPGRVRLPDNLLQALVEVTSLSFETALRAAAPVTLALLLSMLVLGFISRTLPQLNILAVGLSVNAVVMLASLMFTLGAALWVFQDQALAVLEQVTASLYPFEPPS